MKIEAGRRRGCRILPQNPSPKKGENAIGVIGKICTRNRPLSGPSRPLCFTADKNNLKIPEFHDSQSVSQKY